MNMVRRKQRISKTDGNQISLLRISLKVEVELM